MSNFAKLDGAVLANPFTIHHEHKGGALRRSNCVPKAVDLDLFDITISQSAEWLTTAEPGGPNYKLSGVITARGAIRDRITVFTMAGAIASFQEVAEVKILPLARERIGGANRATVLDGLEYTGLSSSDVPERGLMEKEPGTLKFFGSKKEAYPSDHEEPHLCIEVCLDEDEFKSFVDRLSATSAPIEKSTMRLILELFEDDLGASAPDPWGQKDYGMLMRTGDQNLAMTRCRMESLRIDFRPNASPVLPRGSIEDATYNGPKSFEQMIAVSAKAIEERLKHMGVAAIIGFVVLVASLVWWK